MDNVLVKSLIGGAVGAVLGIGMFYTIYGIVLLVRMTIEWVVWKIKRSIKKWQK